MSETLKRACISCKKIVVPTKENWVWLHGSPHGKLCKDCRNWQMRERRNMPGKKHPELTAQHEYTIYHRRKSVQKK